MQPLQTQGTVVFLSHQWDKDMKVALTVVPETYALPLLGFWAVTAPLKCLSVTNPFFLLQWRHGKFAWHSNKISQFPFPFSLMLLYSSLIFHYLTYFFHKTFETDYLSVTNIFGNCAKLHWKYFWNGTGLLEILHCYILCSWVKLLFLPQNPSVNDFSHWYHL